MRIAEDAISTQRIARDEQPRVIVAGGRLAAGGTAVAIERVKRNVHTAAIPVVGLRGLGSDDGAWLSGVDECLAAETGTSAMCQQIERHLGMAQAPATAPVDVITDPQRLTSLRRTALLDAEFDADLDALTRIAASLLDAPVALVSLVDRDRQYFKSHVGLDEPWASRRETDLQHSFCQWVVSGAEPLIVGDARDHAVLRHNLAVEDLGVIAYAGTPVASSGHNVGSMCAIDSKPRQWTEEQIAILQHISHLVEAHATVVPAWPTDEERRSCQHVIARGVRAGTQLVAHHGAQLTEEERTEILGLTERCGGELEALTFQAASGSSPLAS